MKAGMAEGSDDLALVHFSGHGIMIEDSLYLLPYDVDARDTVGIKTSAIEISALRRELNLLATKRRVLVLLDACRAGAVTLGDAGVPLASRSLRQILAGSNITVLTSSAASEPSREDPAWANGAFTEALIEALGRRADDDRNGMVTMTELADYLTARIPDLTNGAQTPGIEVHFQKTVFAAGLRARTALSSTIEPPETLEASARARKS
jgi:uncharacterized caspase-like protein